MWGLEHVRVVDGHPFEFVDFPFLVDIYQDDNPRLVIQKGAQLGVTVCAVVRMAHRAGVLGRSCIYYFPNDTAITSFVQGRFDPFVRENPDVQRLIPSRYADNTRLKRMGTGFAHFLGMKGRTQKLSTPADALFFDELDAMTNERDLAVAKERTAASKYPEDMRLSTPTVPGYGINREFEATDQKNWTMTCPHCGHRNEAGMLQFPKCVEQGFLGCNKCRKALNVRQGEWVAKFPGRPVSGYWVPRFISPRANYTTILDEYRHTLNLQNFYNSTLGMPYSDSETAVTAAHVLTLCGPDPMATMAQGCTMGIDVGTVLHVWVSAPGKHRMRRLVWAGEVNWRQADELVQRFGVKRFAIDALPEQHQAREFVMRHRSKGWLVFYSHTQRGTYAWNDEARTVTVNRTESLDASQRMLRDSQYELPRRCETIETVARHCAAIARKQDVDEQTGEVTNVYVRTEADHYRQAMNYDMLCWDTGSMPTTRGGVLKLNEAMLSLTGGGRKVKVRKW